jgi:transcriptional regulator with XRE-family HTH domain
MLTVVSFSFAPALRAARRAAGLSQEELAVRAGLSRMTVQKLESGAIDPRLSTVEVLVRAVGLDLLLVPAELKEAAEMFLRSGGRAVAQPAGVSAPPSIVEVLTRPPPRRRR